MEHALTQLVMHWLRKVLPYQPDPNVPEELFINDPLKFKRLSRYHVALIFSTWIVFTFIFGALLQAVYQYTFSAPPDYFYYQGPSAFMWYVCGFFCAFASMLYLAGYMLSSLVGRDTFRQFLVYSDWKEQINSRQLYRYINGGLSLLAALCLWMTVNPFLAITPEKMLRRGETSWHTQEKLLSELVSIDHYTGRINGNGEQVGFPFYKMVFSDDVWDFGGLDGLASAAEHTRVQQAIDSLVHITGIPVREMGVFPY